MKNKIVCSLLLCFLRACAMDMPPEESFLQKVYGTDRGGIVNFQVASVTPRNTNDAIPVKILRDDYTNTVCITAHNCIKRDEEQQQWICRPSLLDEIQQRFASCGSRENILNVLLSDGNTSVLLGMHIRNIRGENKVDDFIAASSYYINNCEKYDSTKESHDNVVQGKILRCNWNVYGNSAEFNVESHPFWIKVDGNSEKWLWSATLNTLRREEIVDCLKEQKPFILRLSSPYKGDVINVLINKFVPKPIHTTVPGALSDDELLQKKIEKSSQPSWVVFFGQGAMIIVPFCGLVAYLMHLYFKNK